MSATGNAWEARLLLPGDEDAYSDLVASSCFSPLAHTLAWRNVLAGLELGEPVYWLAYQCGRLRGALPAFVRRTEIGAVLNSLPFIQSTGGVIHNPDAGLADRAELAQVLGQAMLSWCRDHGVEVACVIGSAFQADGPENAWPYAPDFCVRRVVRALDLTEPLAYCPSVLGSIKKAERARPVLHEARSPEDARLVFDLYAGHMRGLAVEPLPWDFFARAYAEAGPRRWTRFVWAEVNAEPAAGLILMWHGAVVDYFSVGSTPQGRAVQAGSWLCAQQIRAARDAGVHWWNWMASPNPSVYDFKKRWGGHDREYAIQGWLLGRRQSWLGLGAARLRALFPGYYVAPYEMLKAA
jgi:hypothetical protein